MKKNKLNEKKVKDLFNLLFELLDNKKLPDDLRKEYLDKVVKIVNG